MYRRQTQSPNQATIGHSPAGHWYAFANTFVPGQQRPQRNFLRAPARETNSPIAFRARVRVLLQKQQILERILVMMFELSRSKCLDFVSTRCDSLIRSS
jgi:hypothetical protein